MWSEWSVCVLGVMLKNSQVAQGIMYSHSQKNIEWRWAVTRECALERLARFLVAPQPVTRLTLAAAVEHAQGVTVARVKAACQASCMAAN